ncbi:hypothetical protein GQX73_g10615 [Xylaria multiplex]|uniref:PRELI/MSF1 domain-containing protein n=1 Tax=Xylaria multiplex TaxID=323545 RepID=A0A7C8IKZ4_9PEZI|nr:hypothetical protein GQX73_g10615 [Xylaria multiplex]
MVLTRTTNHTYSHPFPTVTLAFFLRYYSPQLNPFSSHVLSTDTISSHVDPVTGRLHTTRIHLKNYVLETSVVDMKEGWMKTESRNLNFTGVLSVVEEQHYSTSPPDGSAVTGAGSFNNVALGVPRPLSPNTFVTTTFSYRSTLGNKKHDRAPVDSAETPDETGPRRLGSWISGWGANRIQRSIESIASNKTDDQLIKSRDGMGMVLERLRNNSVVSVLRELRRREGKAVFDQ